MSIILFEEGYYNNFPINLIDNSSIILINFDTQRNKSFINKLYINGIRVIHIENKDCLKNINIDLSIGAHNTTDLIYKEEKLYHNLSQVECKTTLASKNKEKNSLFPTEFKHFKMIDKINGNNEQLTERQISNTKFHNSMKKEANKLMFAENKEKYKKKMRQSSSLPRISSTTENKISKKKSKVKTQVETKSDITKNMLKTKI